MKRGSALEDALAFQIKATGLPAPVREFQFHPTRKWRLDFAWPAELVAVEIDGGLFVFGRHSRGRQQIKDMDKRNEALCLGWKVLRVSGEHITKGQALAWLERLLK